MAAHQPDSTASRVPHVKAGTAGWMPGEKLLLVGVAAHAATDLTELYRQFQRPLPSIQVFATATGALERLAEESFDCILVENSPGPRADQGVDARGVCTAIRGAGSLDAVLVLSTTTCDSLWNVMCETESELYVGLPPWQSPTLLRLIERAVQQRAMSRDSQRRNWAHGQRIDRERGECNDLLRQQRQLLQATADRRFASVEAMLPAQLPQIYREVLRTYVMTGTANLAVEIKKLAQTFALAHLTPRQVWQLHLDQVELLVKGIGQRSARHILDRANVLCLELMVLLCECFEEQNARTWWAWRRQPVSDAGVSLERRAA